MSRIEFGSVRFFKRIITFIVMLVVAGLLTGLLFIWSKYADACERLAELEKSALSIEVSQQEAGQNTGLLVCLIHEMFLIQEKTLFTRHYIRNYM